MTTSLGPALPPNLCARFSQASLPALLGRALPLVTRSADGSAHPMLCSYLELLATDARTLRLAIDARSRSAHNLEERAVATLLVIEPEQTIYIKCRATGPPLRLGALARFSLVVDDVLEDAAAAAEGPVRITGGITYAPPPSLDDPRAQATLAALRAS